MAEFVDRDADLSNLNRIAAGAGAQFIIVYGRRRVGKPNL